jgi:hypothetical protein
MNYTHNHTYKNKKAPLLAGLLKYILPIYFFGASVVLGAAFNPIFFFTKAIISSLASAYNNIP